MLRVVVIWKIKTSRKETDFIPAYFLFFILIENFGFEAFLNIQ